jgi:hypothetical protein
VGLVDPITAADVAERVNDGLPETLEEVARHYGHRWWKLKVGGNLVADIDRLCQIAAVLDAGPAYQASLDGNEQYADGESALALWQSMMAEPRLARLCASIAYIEQPVARARALDTSMSALGKARPVIIDESDGDLSAFVTAKGLGYAGVSTKACKGFWRSFVNHARCRAWNDAGGQYFMSAEDLTTLAGLCVQQDLALGRAVEAGDAVEQRGLAGTVRPDEPGDGALVGGDGHVVQHPCATEGDAEALALEECHLRCLPRCGAVPDRDRSARGRRG